MVDKWAELRLILEGTLSHNVQYSQDRAFDRYSYQRVLIWMDMLEQREKEESFLYTGVPSFDQKSFEEILKEHGLQGLA